MDFNRIRLTGFKSFVDGTDFDIMEGLTGIVGPNGCGKSNLLEALRWVMGETSYKSMRGSAMEDVIFSGTTGRPSRNHAEVSLFLDNSKRTASAEFNDNDELEIVRRIERDAGSAYRINGRDVRARDVQLLFADASTGARSNSLVRQGQIGELISAKPETRRRILEEAAGISGLHSRRHEAELRLRAASNNLEKLDEVLAQLESQLRSLKRQARQAGRYKEISGQIRAAEALTLYLRWQQTTTRLTQIEGELKEAQSAVISTNTAVAAAASASTNAQTILPTLREEEATAAAALRRLTLERDAMDNEKRQAEDMLMRLGEQAKTIAADKERETEVVRDSDQQLAHLAGEEVVAQASISEEEEQAEAEAAKKLEIEEAQLAQADEAFDTANREHAEYHARINALRRGLSGNDEQEVRLVEELATLETTRTDIKTARGQDLDLAARQATLTELQAEMEAAFTKHETQHKNYAEARKTHDEAQAPAHEKRSTLSRLIGERDALSGLFAKENEDGQSYVPVLSQVSVQNGYEVALGAALGDDLEAALDKSAPAYWDAAMPSDSPSALPDNIESLADYVSGVDALHRRLQQIGVVADRAQGVALCKRLSVGQRLVSKQGDLWRWDGYCRLAEAETNTTRRLAQKRRLELLTTDITTAQSETEAAEAQLEKARTALEAARNAAEAAQQGLQAAQQNVDTARQDLSQAETGAAKLNALEASFARVEKDLQATREAQAAMRHDLQKLETTGDGATALEEKRVIVQKARDGVAEAHSELQNWRTRREARDTQLQRIKQEQQSWTARHSAATQQLEILAARAIETQTEVEKFNDVPRLVEEKKIQIADIITQAAEKRAAAGDALAVAETTLADLSTAEKQAQSHLAEAREAQVRLEATQEAESERMTESAQRIRDVLQIEPEAALALSEHERGEPFPDVEELESKLENYRRERETLGGVNLQADNEAEEIATQIETMKVERDDLASAINKLRHGIGQLNREGRQRLLAAYESVNKHFEVLFTRMFGGGTARLELTESDDPLEAGLEIIAHPPGKRPQHMSLLSGGEQALTAVAMIFAVFLTNPSPICVLDEVDAPLDDSNVDRFCALLRDITEQTGTRFLVITHHALTMARMDRLFGVTMQERGVSQLLSVNLATAEQFAEVGVHENEAETPATLSAS